MAAKFTMGVGQGMGCRWDAHASSQRVAGHALQWKRKMASPRWPIVGQRWNLESSWGNGAPEVSRGSYIYAVARRTLEHFKDMCRLPLSFPANPARFSAVLRARGAPE